MAEEQIRRGGAQTAREAAAKVRASRPTAREIAELDGQDGGGAAADPAFLDDEAVDEPVQDDEGDAEARSTPQVFRADFDPAVDPSKVPSWVKIPKDLEFPPHGVTWTAMLFEPEWTDRPHLGQRQCILWNLSVGDEKFARRRARGDAEAMLDEQAKQMIRAIDGQRINWGNPSAKESPDLFWDEMGKRCRGLVLTYFLKIHSLEPAEKLHFFAHCLVVRTVAPSSTGRPRTTARGRSTPTR